MFKLRYLVFFLTLFLAGTLSAQERNSSSVREIKPGLVFSEMTYDFGTIKSDTIVSHIYKFENVSLDTIKINKVGTSWGCTGTLLSSEAIAPGEAGEIKVSFRSRGRKGKQNKRITVSTNDTNHPVYRLYFKGEILREEKSE